MVHLFPYTFLTLVLLLKTKSEKFHSFERTGGREVTCDLVVELYATVISKEYRVESLLLTCLGTVFWRLIDVYTKF